MKKSMIFAALLTAPLCANAQMFDFSNSMQPIQMSEEFVNHLEKCEAFSEDKNTDFMDFDMNVTYTIKGRNAEGECEVEMFSETMGIDSLQRCHFSDDDIAMYVPAIRYVLKNMDYTVEGSQKMMKNEKWQLAMSMMMDEEKCKYFRSEVDLTKALRAKLRTCSPYSDTQETGPTTITRNIIGEQNGRCAFEENIMQKAQDMSSIIGKDMPENLRDAITSMPEMHVKIKCKFDAAQLSQYEAVLKSMIIPAAESIEDAIPDMDSINPRAEAEFLQQNCEMDMDE